MADNIPPKVPKRVRHGKSMMPFFKRDDVCEDFREVLVKVVEYHHLIESVKSRDKFSAGHLEFVKFFDRSIPDLSDVAVVRKCITEHYQERLEELKVEFHRKFTSEQRGVFQLTTLFDEAVQEALDGVHKRENQYQDVKGKEAAFQWVMDLYLVRYWPAGTLRPDDARFWAKVDAELVRKSRGPEDPTSNLFIIEGKVEVRGVKYASTEHAYQVIKLLFFGAPQSVIEEVKSCLTGKQAKRRTNAWMDANKPRDKYGYEWCMWDEQRMPLMVELEEAKFQVCSVFRDHLFFNRSSRIVHTVGDDYWGTGGGPSGDLTDMMGTILTKMKQDRLNPKGKLPWVVPTYHGQYSYDEKSVMWNIPVPTKQILVLGDSESARIPPFLHASCQVESFPGCPVEILFQLVDKLVLPEGSIVPSSVIIQIGINNVIGYHGLNIQLFEQSFSNLLGSLILKFRDCTMYVVPLQMDTTEKDPNGHAQKLVNDTFSKVVTGQERFKNVKLLGLLPEERFRLEDDLVHWKPSTGKALMQGWLSSITGH